MSGKRRVYQVAERVKEVIASALLRTADPRFSLVTVTSVMVSPDLRNAKVYWVVSLPTSADRDARLNDVDEAFHNAHGMFKWILGKELGLRFVPDLSFFYDDTYDTVDEVERLMHHIRTTSPGSNAESSDIESSEMQASAETSEGGDADEGGELTENE
jgi:ribosome-binding factor A